MLAICALIAGFFPTFGIWSQAKDTLITHADGLRCFSSYYLTTTLIRISSGNTKLMLHSFYKSLQIWSYVF